MTRRSAAEVLASIIVIIGGINWGLVGLFELDLVALIFGSIPLIQRAVYIIVGIAAVYLAFALTKRDVI